MRHFIYTAMPLKRLRWRLIGLLERTAQHDEIYDREYYLDTVDPHMAPAANTIADSIVDEFSPRSAVDVGCGTGQLLLALERRGVSCTGIEYADAALQICRDRNLTVLKHDLESDASLDLRSDVVISTEVAEHLPKSCAERFVALLCRVSDIVVFTAADPSVAGTNHVNEQPKEYWIEKFERRGFEHAEQLSIRWGNEWRKQQVAGGYANTVMVFRRFQQAQ